MIIKKKKQHFKRYLWILFVIPVVLIAISIYLFLSVGASERKIFHLSFVALMLGLVFEYRRITDKWTTVLWTLLGAYLLSFFAFARGKRESYYHFEAHLERWPWFFLGAFIVIALMVHYKTITQGITEGTTLLLTVAINYWLWANGYWETELLIVKLLIYINICFSVVAVFHAFTYTPLGRGARLALSIWSSIILLILAIDHILYHFKYGEIEKLPALFDQLFVFLQYFLLGVSGIYMAHNLSMIAAYLPGKYYKENIRKMNSLHVKRFSEKQVRIIDATVVLLFSLSIFGINAFYSLLPVNFVIWGCIGSAPFVISWLPPLLRKTKMQVIRSGQSKGLR